MSPFEWIDATPLSVAVRESPWLFPTLETAHVLALGLTVGSIAMVDLRLLGWTNRDRPVEQMLSEFLPWTWTAFAMAVVSGLLMFSSAATRYAGLTPFIAKMLLLGLAGINMAVFQYSAHRTIGEWGRDRRPPLAARAAGAISLLLWLFIVTLGRWIGFV
jgi:cytochrome bd-type quinol oxidase subunit 1